MKEAEVLFGVKKIRLTIEEGRFNQDDTIAAVQEEGFGGGVRVGE